MKAKKNLHLEHIEDEILNFGTFGARESITFLQSLRDMLSGSSDKKVTITTKFDGAPAIFVGTDPEDGKFFVGTKGVFNVDAKLVKSLDDISKHGYKGALANKLKVSFQELSKLGIKKVIQGDLLYTRDDLKPEVVDGIRYTTFQPNTIVYAIEEDSELDKKIKQSKLGIVFHTTYSGKTLPEMSASFGADASGLKEISSVWFSDVDYDDFSGFVSMTKKETYNITKLLSETGKTFRKIKTKDLDAFLDVQNQIPNSAIGASLKTYNNSKIRKGEKISNPVQHVEGYIKYFIDFYDEKVIGKAQQEKTKMRKKSEKNAFLSSFRKYMPMLMDVMEMYNLFVEAKQMVIDKLDKGARKFSKTFVRTETGFKVVNEEGYVAIDRMKGNAVKLVDRLEFSYNNFNGIKNWDK
jgi:hypothetical protein